MNDSVPHDFSDGACPSYSTLRHFAKGALTDALSRAVEEHLETCDSCIAALEAADSSRDSFEEYIRDFDAQLCEESGFRRLCATLDAQIIAPHATSANTRSLANLDAELPAILGNYRLVERIGQGAMGIVYKAQHTRLKTWVAVKLLSPSKLNTRDAVNRFAQEMETIGKLPDHPHVVRARDAGQIDQQYFLVMDYVDAVDVNLLLRRHGPLDAPDACEAARQTSLALAHAHAHGLIHRDVKPSNMMLTRSGEIKLLDLGLASCRGSEVQESEVVGTTDFMAPEQWEPRDRLGPATDVYSLGCTLFKLLVGYAPFAKTAKSARAKRQAHRSLAVPCLSELRPIISPELSTLVQRMMAKHPCERISSAEEMAGLLVPFCEGAKLRELAASVLTEGSGSEHPTRDETWAEWATAPMRRSKISRRSLGLTLAGLAAAGWSIAKWIQPSNYRMLLGKETEKVVWDYDPLRFTLTVHATDTVLFARDAGIEIPTGLTYKIARHNNAVTAGVFFGHQIAAQEGWKTETFRTVEISGDDDPSGARFSLRDYVVSRSPTHLDLVSWRNTEMAAMSLPNAPRQSTEQTLHLEFEKGGLSGASFNGTSLTALLGAAASFPTGKPGTQAFGVFCTEGSAGFKEMQIG